MPSPQQIGLPRSPAPVAQPVGRMQILVRRRQGEATVADVELSIFNDDRFIYLEGIVVREPRPGWITMEIPPLEKWEKPMRWLMPEQRERIQSPDFYQLLQTHVTRKYLAARAATATAGGQQPHLPWREAAWRVGPRPRGSPAAQRPMRLRRRTSLPSSEGLLGWRCALGARIMSRWWANSPPC